MLIDFGNKTLSFGKRHNMATSILYAEIANLPQYRQAHGDKAAESIVATVAGVLENSIRKEELACHIDEAQFAIVLPNTKAFKAHIVATRVKQSVENLAFEIGNTTIRIDLAVGLCSTEEDDTVGNLSFEKYCVHASHALSASHDTPNKRIVRYDETYEKKISEDPDTHAPSTPEKTDTHAPSTSEVTDIGNAKHNTHKFTTVEVSDGADDEQDTMDAFGDFFSCILSGKYSSIPTEFLPSLIEPLESFLEYAHATIDDNKKISGE